MQKYVRYVIMKVICNILLMICKNMHSLLCGCCSQADQLELVNFFKIQKVKLLASMMFKKIQVVLYKFLS